MPRNREVPSEIAAPTHCNGVRNCVVMTNAAIHTIELPEGHFTAIVHDNPDGSRAAIAILDHDEVELHIEMLRNSVEDAKRLDQGLPPIDRGHKGVKH